MGFERSKGQRNIFLRSGTGAEGPNKIPSKIGSFGNPLEEPDGCSGRVIRLKMWTGPVISNERCVMSTAFDLCYSLTCASRVNKACSHEDEDDITSSDEEGEHNVWNCFQEVLASDSPGMLLESFFEDEELTRTALSCHL